MKYIITESINLPSSPPSWILALALAAAFSADISHGASAPLVALQAANLPEGPLASWDNTGSLKGVFKNDGTNPQVKVIDGVKAVDFSGKDHMLADFKASAGIVGNQPWTVIVKTHCRNLGDERTLVSWANRPDNCLELQYGDSTQFGAIGTWSGNVSGWLENLPAKDTWHTFIYSYAGGPDGEFHAWCDGNLRVNRKFSLSIKADRPLVIGACMAGDPAANVGYTHHIDGAIASVQVYDRGFTTLECWNASGFQSAHLIAPLHGAVLDAVTTTLQWEMGSSGVVAYALHVGTTKSQLDLAPKSQVATKDTFPLVVSKLTETQYGPLKLALGTTYYWRVDQLDASGKVTQKGLVAEFKTETGNAVKPVPADSYIMVEGGKHELSWTPGKYATKQNVYIGESAAEVLAKKTPDFAGLAPTVASISLPNKNLAPGKSYFWRVESTNSAPLSASAGEVWSFRNVKKKLKVYISSGQSNSVGCSMVTPMPDKYKGYNKNVIVFVRGECRLGEYGWAYLRDGLGSGFGDRDGKGTFGPELLFGYTMAPQDPAQVMAIVKIAWGATNLGVQWRSPSAGGVTGNLYTNWVKFYQEAMAKLDPAFEPEVAGMLWMQGESDASDKKMTADYAKNLAALIKDVRAEVKQPDMPVVLAQISKTAAWGPDLGDGLRAAQLEVTKSVPHTATFATDDYKLGDPWHYDTAGMISLGERFAKAMRTLEKN
ncbi:MAG: sialate O-acetylesterase [Verrucomicrobia bacterium]|nr:MAG: sialate O-acetylesterase [Verrucomicrobiota bacterium]